MKLLVTASFVATALVALSHSAHAKGAICEQVQPDLFSIDGMTDDWSSFKVVTYGSGRDTRLEVKCAYDDKKLYMMLNVADERLLRTKKGNAKSEDRVNIELGVAKATPLRIVVLPGSLRAPRKAISVPKFVELEDSLQDEGFSLELSIPMNKIKDWSPSVPYFNAKVQYHDLDAPSDRQSVVGLKGRVHFGAAVDTYRAFMRTVGLSNRDVKLDVLVDADPGAGPERVIIGGRVLGLVGMSFNYMTLPIASSNDLISCRVVDFDGAGRYAVLTELRQHGNGGSRDVLIAWFANGDGSFHPALTVETRKEMGENRITNSWALVPRGKHRELEGKKKRKRRGKFKAPPGRDILFQVGEAVGFDASNYREAPAPDAKSILLPWGEQQSALYYFEGTSPWGGDEGIDLPKK
jgi:hypothetical protein